MSQLTQKQSSRKFYEEYGDRKYFLRFSPYLKVNDGIFKRLIRGLYYRYIDELYLPYKGTEVIVKPKWGTAIRNVNHDDKVIMITYKNHHMKLFDVV